MRTILLLLLVCCAPVFGAKQLPPPKPYDLTKIKPGMMVWMPFCMFPETVDWVDEDYVYFRNRAPSPQEILLGMHEEVKPMRVLKYSVGVILRDYPQMIKQE